MLRSLLLPAPLLTLVLTGCLPELPEEKQTAEGATAGDCTDGADNDEDGTFDCEDSGCAAAPACQSEPAPPEGLAVAVTPELPEDDDDLRCAITSEAVDPNGDAVTYTYAWSVDGADAALSTDTVGSALTHGGENWTCTVTPSDGTLTGTPASATVTIQRANAAPSAPVVAIIPAEPTDDEGLTCAVVGESVDPDGDAVTYAWAWSVDGVDAGIAGESVDAARTSVGETWTCSVTASDGSASSAAGSASVTVADGTLDEGLIVHFPFDGDTADHGPNAYASTSDDVTFGEDRHGTPNGAAQFNGTSTYVHAEPVIQVSAIQPVSLSAWYRWDDTGDSRYPTIVRLAPRSCGTIGAMIEADRASAQLSVAYRLDCVGGPGFNMALEQGRWTHVTAVYDPPTWNVYVDGTLMSATTYGAGAGTAATAVLALGWRGAEDINGWGWFDGAIDEVRVYERALTPAEAAALAAR